jgi:hypothetical protein
MIEILLAAAVLELPVPAVGCGELLVQLKAGAPHLMVK